MTFLLAAFLLLTVTFSIAVRLLKRHFLQNSATKLSFINFPVLFLDTPGVIGQRQTSTNYRRKKLEFHQILIRSTR